MVEDGRTAGTKISVEIALRDLPKPRSANDTNHSAIRGVFIAVLVELKRSLARKGWKSLRPEDKQDDACNDEKFRQAECMHSR